MKKYLFSFILFILFTLPCLATKSDYQSDTDFGRYMKDLQKSIISNWHPLKGNETIHVVLVFKISKQGNLLSSRVLKSSGIPAEDRAALDAVKSTAPFAPLPKFYTGDNIEIQFTFDPNVLGAQ